MKLLLLPLFVTLLFSCSFSENQEPTLKDVFHDNFLVGVALNVDHISGTGDETSQSLIKSQFNSISPENCLKSMFIQPEEGVFSFDYADKYVNYGVENKMFTIGHALVWHSQVPDWIFVDKAGNDVTREVLIARMKNHILTLVGRYKGKVKGWDVVNEAISDDSNVTLRESKWQQIIGDDFIELAFQFAHEADPDA